MKWFLAIFVCLFCVDAAAQVAVMPLLESHQHFVDASGNPCAGCSLYSYLAGTTTPTPTYTDSTGGPTNTNPIVLDASGSATIWTAYVGYKFILKDASGTLLWTADNITGGFISATKTGLQTMAGPLATPALTTGSLNSVCVVDGTFHTTIAACLASLPTGVIADTGHSYKYGAVYLPASSLSYPVAATITIGPFVKIVGEGMTAQQIACHASPCIAFPDAVSSIVGDGGLYNVAVLGDGSSSEVGLLSTDGIGLVLRDVRFTGFNGTGAIGTELLNVNYWHERMNFSRVLWDKDTTGLALVGGGTTPTASFGHNTMTDLMFNVIASQTAISLSSNAALYDSVLTGVVNADNSTGISTAFTLSGTAQIGPTVLINMSMDSGGGGGTGTYVGVSCGSGMQFRPTGNFTGYSGLATFQHTYVGCATMSSLPTGLAEAVGIDGASPGIGTWLTPSDGVTNGDNNCVGDNAYFGIDGNWHTNGDGANNGGWMICRDIGGNPPQIYLFPSTGGNGQTIGQASLSGYLVGTIATLEANQTFSGNNTHTGINQFGALIFNPGLGSADIITATAGNYLIVQPPASATHDFGVHDSTGAKTNFLVNDNSAVSTLNNTLDDGSGNATLKTIAVASARRGTFTCTAGGTISITNANYIATSDVVITMNTAGGTISTPPAMKTVTPTTGFSVLCGASDTSVYNYSILN